MKFNPILLRRSYDEGSLQRVLHTEYDEQRPMGNVAINDVARVVLCWLIGLSAEIKPVINRSLEWLDLAIAGNEDFGENRYLHLCTLSWAKALGLWMRDCVNDASVWAQVRRLDDAAQEMGNTWPAGQKATYRLDDYLAYCYQAQQYDAGIAAFLAQHSDKAKTLSPARVLKPRELGYLLCLQETSHQFDPADLLTAGKKMLKANLDEKWLGAGQYIRAATWLKIVYWHHDQSLTPLQTVLKAYDSMPHLQRPE